MKQILSLVLNQPLMIAPAKLSAIIHALQDNGYNINLADAVQPTPAALKAAKGDEPVYLGSGVGVLPIHGSLVHRAGGLQAMSGLTSYSSLSNQLAQLVADPSIDHIVLNMDSHGGHVNGAFDLADEIYAAREHKQITAIIDESAYSAGYLLASSAHEIIATRTAGVGSVGVITAHVDRSENNAQQGIKVTALYAGARKNDMNPNEPLTDEAKTLVEQHLQQSYQMFVETVARNRGLSVDAVKQTEAGFYVGQEAVSIGFADKIQPAREALSDIVKSNFEARQSRSTNGRLQRAAIAMKVKAASN